MVGPVGYDDFAGFTHAFLIREPERMIASYLRKREAAAFEDFGLERQAEFFEREADRLGHAPPVIDANDVLANPEGTLSKLCAALGIAWDPAMLSWAPGRRATDGPWAPHWYAAVEASTGFGPPDDDPVAAAGRGPPPGRAAAGPITSGWRPTDSRLSRCAAGGGPKLARMKITILAAAVAASTAAAALAAPTTIHAGRLIAVPGQAGARAFDDRRRQRPHRLGHRRPGARRAGRRVHRPFDARRCCPA